MVAEIALKLRRNLDSSDSRQNMPIKHFKESDRCIVKNKLSAQLGKFEQQYLHFPDPGLKAQQSITEQIIQLARTTDHLDNILGTTVKLLERAFQAKCCIVWQPDADRESKICYVSHSANADPLIRLCRKLSDCYSYTLSKGILLCVSEREEIPSPTIKTAMAVAHADSFILAPLEKNLYLGEICLFPCRQGRQWTEAELECVRNVATQCAIVIEKAQLAKQLQQQHAGANLLKEISRTINSDLALEQVLPTVLEIVGRSFGAERVVLFCQRKKELQVWGEWQVSPQILDQMTLILSSDSEEIDAHLNNGAQLNVQCDCVQNRQKVPKVGYFDYGSILSVPVFIRSQFFGSLVLSATTKRTFTAEEISLVESVVDQMAIAIHSAESVKLCQKLQAYTQQLEAEKQRAQEADRAKSDFLSVMNHELRSPLTGIIGFSRMLAEEIYGVLNPKQTQYVNAITESGKYLLDLINDLLDISKIEAQKEELYLERVAVEDVCLSSLSIVQERARQAGLELKLEIDANVSFCMADQRRLKQILVNLLSNAVKFTEAGGSVVLKVRQEKMLQLSVIDTGIGISQADQKKLFQPFAQINHSLNRKHKGTGLGLALSRKLALLHGGDLTLTSEVGKGSCFTVHLPIEGCKV